MNAKSTYTRLFHNLYPNSMLLFTPNVIYFRKILF